MLTCGSADHGGWLDTRVMIEAEVQVLFEAALTLMQVTRDFFSFLMWFQGSD